MQNRLPNRFERLLVALALAMLRGGRFVLKELGRGARAAEPGVRVVGRVFLSLIALPIYRLIVYGRLRLARLLSATHGLVFLIFTNRYVLHGALIAIAVGTVASQFQPASATALDTHHTLLYALATNGQDEIVEETVHPEQSVKNANYLGADTLQAVPAVDFDYEAGVAAPAADLTVPGSLAVQPGATAPGVPGQPPTPARTQTETYTVQSGDTVASIARRFGVNVGTIVWANKLGNLARINPGDTLKIPALSGVLHAIARGDTVEKLGLAYHVNADDIASANHLAPNQGLRVGDEIVIPGATPLEPAAQPKSTPIAVRTDIPQTPIPNKSYDQYQEIIQSPPDVRVKPPDETVTALPKNKLLWPTISHLINQYYGWFHTGVDIDGDYTSPIYAADDGVVETAGWNNGGYGLMIFIDHQDGYKTRYGHASKLFVSAGDHVKRGQVIAMIGTTGRSTGTHLHFEVYVNDRRVNPLAYIR